MYLIGFFASPLPYIVLFGLYMSGFAFFNWKAGQDPAEGHGCSPQEVYVVSGPAHHMGYGLCSFSANDGQGHDHAASNTDGAMPPPLRHFHPPPLHPLTYPDQCRPVALLILPSGLAIRPPPLS